MNTPVVDKLIIPFQVNVSSDGKEKRCRKKENDRKDGLTTCVNDSQNTFHLENQPIRERKGETNDKTGMNAAY